MKLRLYLLAVPWAVVWTSSMTSTEDHWPICPAIANHLCPGSYVPDFKNHRIVCHEGEDGCKDFVDAMNQAHERRNTTTWIIPSVGSRKAGDILKCDEDTRRCSYVTPEENYEKPVRLEEWGE